MSLTVMGCILKHTACQILFICFVGAVSAMAESHHSYVPSAGFVPNEVTAIAIARAVWVPIYGSDVLKQEPFKAELRKEVWHVEGSLPEGFLGGVAEIEIEKKTGQILRVSHGQ